MPRVVDFEIHAEDPDRAEKFYIALFGWKFAKWGGPLDYRVIVTGPETEKGINGGLIKRMGAAPAKGQAVNAFVCTVEVPDLDARVAKATSLGAAIALPKMAIPGVGWLAYIHDTEGNILGLMQPDSAAA